ncbi:hypothetical protein AB4510_06180 [Vibrio sp. 10N.222.54.B12]|jgi:hypothetical protein|uniref:Uncharacterized protein n=2 Tax=Vibrio cyclitrophicus TaxID=47951 RepID=A0A7Z1MN02_9VIBR|nr:MULTISPECIES: hypothetical protein [Vibrio]PMP18527.1 hypothetical protein BCS91_24240 [Vibrio cyclitrophicus]PMP33145.1 hypothetical protein BCS90_00045 [Vibrio cyclitrophicus]TKG12232.1 hypothetical protein FCV67_00465 [Vibrio sp. F13]
MATGDNEKKNDQPTEASNSSQELEQLIEKASKPTMPDEPKGDEEPTVIEATQTQTESKTSNLLPKIILVWLMVLSGVMAYAMMVIDKQSETSLSQHPIVFYPFGKAFSALKSQGYDFAAIEKYNNNMIQILNSEGKVVLPAASVHGQLPDSLVVKLMSVDEMNRLASQQSE